MEFFLVLGGLISLPVIKYCTKPVELVASKVNEEEKEEKKQIHEIDPEKLEEYRKRSEIRKEKILSQLTPYERELFMDYIQDIKNPKPRKSFEGCFTCFGTLFLVVLLALAAYILLTNQSKIKHSDL